MSTIWLCNKHGGYGFSSDCRQCNPKPTPDADALLAEFAQALFDTFTERFTNGPYGADGLGYQYRCQHCEKSLDIHHWTQAEHESDCVMLKVNNYLAARQRGG